MKKTCRGYKGVWTTLAVIGLGVLLCIPNSLKAQALPAPQSSTQQSSTTKDSTTPATEATSSSATPEEDANAGTACDLQKGSSDGLVIISATLPPRERHLGFPQSFRYEYKPKDAGWLHNNRAIVIDYLRKTGSDFSGLVGKLYVLRLPAGDYEFKDWEYRPLGMNGTEHPSGIHPLTFNVAAGRAVYLGGLDPTIIEGKNILHQKVDQAWVWVHDNNSRDLPVFFNRCAGFDRTLLDIRVMDASSWIPQKK